MPRAVEVGERESASLTPVRSLVLGTGCRDGDGTVFGRRALDPGLPAIPLPPRRLRAVKVLLAVA